MDPASLRAIPAPTDAVLPQAEVLGLLLLDTRFPRPMGDAGLPASWGGTVRVEVVERAWPDRVVADAASLRASELAARFADAARRLEAAGATCITTSCGFLVLLQAQLQQCVGVPFVSSSLLLLPRLLATQAQVGVLTISAARLGREHLLAAGVPADRLADVIVEGMPAQGEFAGAILGNRADMDVARAGAEVVCAARALQARAPQLRTLVLECTNMPPYAAAIREATGWQVLSLFDAVTSSTAARSRSGGRTTAAAPSRT